MDSKLMNLVAEARQGHDSALGAVLEEVLPEESFPEEKLPKPSPSTSAGHHREWVEACKTGSPTGADFGYAAALTETILLGNIAHRVRRKLEWDSEQMKAIGCPEADAIIRRPPRKGWELPATSGH